MSTEWWEGGTLAGDTLPVAQRHAWSEDTGQWRTPTVGHSSKRNWHLGQLKYALPAVLVALAMAFVLGGQRNNLNVATPPAVATANPVPTPSPSQDERYLQLLVDGGLVINSLQDVIAGGHWICAYLSHGHSPNDVVSLWDSEEFAQNHHWNQAYVDAAVKVYCPQFA